MSSHRHNLSEAEIVQWARAHCRRTRQWPDRYDGPIKDARGESWFGIDAALRGGLRGLPKRKSLGLLFSDVLKPGQS